MRGKKLILMPYLEKLKAIKDEKDMSNVEIARLSGIPLATITRIFNGNTPNPTFETCARMATALGTSLDEIAGLKQPDAQPVLSPIENTLNSYAELLKEKDDRIRELKDEIIRERKERLLVFRIFAIFVAFLLVLLTADILNGHFGYFRA